MVSRDLRRGRPLPQFLKENEMDRLLDAESWTESFEDVRDRTGNHDFL